MPKLDPVEVDKIVHKIQHLNSEEISMLLNNEVICEETKNRLELHLCDCIECSAWLETMKEIDQMSPEAPFELTEDEENYFLADLHRRIALLKIDDDNGNIYREGNLIRENILINNEIEITPGSSPFVGINALSSSKIIYTKWRIVKILFSVSIIILYKIIGFLIVQIFGNYVIFILNIKFLKMFFLIIYCLHCI